VLDVIARESIIPYFQDSARKQSWQDFEKVMTAQHGPFGAEAVYGAWMMDAAVRNDWASFGTMYAKYYETAIPRSRYSANSLSYQVLQHVTDTKVLETAVRLMKWNLDAPQEFPVFGRYDPSKLDTYAGLLHKLCRPEALEWQHRAVILADGRDADIIKNFEKMKAGPARGCEAT